MQVLNSMPLVRKLRFPMIGTVGNIFKQLNQLTFLTELCIKRSYVRSIRSEREKVYRKVETKEVENKGSLNELLNNAASFKDDGSKYPGDVWSSSSYPVGSSKKRPRDQASYSTRPNIDPSETSLFLFPGQGSQFVGMGSKLLSYPNVKEMYNIASEILGYNLLKMCLEGPKSELNKTIHCQPAIIVTSLAAAEKLRDEKPEMVESCVAAAGFSVGEFSALVFSGAISFEDAVKVVKIRAEAMQAASELVPSGMMTIFYTPAAKINYACVVAKEWCRKLGIEKPECRVANYLYPHCKVLAGNQEALQFIEMNAQDFGIRRLKHLPVSGAFHTDLMLPAEAPLKEALKHITINKPLISVHSNVDGKVYRNPQHIQKGLVEQISSPVKWEQTMHILYERTSGSKFPHTYECGPGNSLRTILKMVNLKAADETNCIEV